MGKKCEFLAGPAWPREGKPSVTPVGLAVTITGNIFHFSNLFV